MGKIREYFIMKKIEKYASENITKDKKKKKKISKLYLAEVVIGLILILLNLIIKNLIFLGSMTIFYAMFCIILKLILTKNKKTKKEKIKSIYLLDGNNKKIKKWEIEDLKALLMGKTTDDEKVDIDLTEAEYSSLISRNHAVINRTSSGWYFEDIGSSNGSGIKESEEEERYRIYPGEVHKLESGNMIYLANTKLLIK